MGETIPLDESKNLDPQQWIKVYGVCPDDRLEYLNTCQVYQLEAVENSVQPDWFKEIVVEPVNEGA